MGRLNLVTAPTAEPVTLADAKLHLRVNVSDDDALITDALIAGRERVELETGRQLITATWELWMDGFPGQPSSGIDGGMGYGAWGFDSLASARWLDWNLWWKNQFIDMPLAPLQSVASIKYIDASGVQQTWDPTQYQVDAPVGPRASRGRIKPAYGVSWPVTRDQMDSVIVQFTAGYGAAATAVPSMLRRAILLIAGDFYENREGTVVTDRRVTVQELPYGVSNILQQYRARPIARAAA